VTRHRPARAILGCAGLIVATVGLAPLPAAADTVALTCVGDDSVAPGQVVSGFEPQDQLVNILLDNFPDRSAAVLEAASGDAAVEGRLEVDAPPAVTPGAQDVDFVASLLLGDAFDLPTSATALDQIEIELTAGDGVTGAPVVATGGPTTQPQPPPAAVESAFAGPFDITAGIGDEATWDLTRLDVVLTFEADPNTIEIPVPDDGPWLVVGPSDVTIGLRCTTTGSPTASALVLPHPTPAGPVVPHLDITTTVDTPVEIDLLAGVEDGPAAPTDRDTVEILASPEAGALGGPIDGVVTYTPDPGYAGPDRFAYQVCTEPYDLAEPTEAPAGRGQLSDIVSCNAALVSLTVIEDTGTTTTTETSVVTGPSQCACRVAEPQPEPPTFTG
jgi:hypothetical protein